MCDYSERVSFSLKNDTLRSPSASVACVRYCTDSLHWCGHLRASAVRTNHTRACLTVPHYILKGQVICITLRLRSIHLKLERFRGRGGLSVNQAGALRHSGRSSPNASDVRTRHDRLAMVTCAHHGRPPRGAFRTTFLPENFASLAPTLGRQPPAWTSQGWRAAGSPGPALSKPDYFCLKSAEFTPCKPGGGAWDTMVR